MGSFDDFVSHITDGKVFLDSCKNFKDNLSAPLIITCISMCFMVFAGFDYINNNKFGYGQKYYEAWEAMAPLAVGMIGITCLTPTFRLVLMPLIAPIFKGMTAHPAMFAGVLLDPAMGGLFLARSLAPDNEAVALYSSIILGTMLGCTICFNIPVGLSTIPKKYHIFFAYGTLIGIISLPFGCIIGGAAMNLTPHKLSFVAILQNLIPVIVITVIIAGFLFFLPIHTLHGFLYFSKAITFLMTFGAILAIFQEKTLIRFPLFSTMVDDNGDNSLLITMESIGGIAIMLTGTMPMVHFVVMVLGKYLAKLGSYASLTEIDSSGVVSCFATALPMFSMFKDMTHKGMIVNAAFVCGAGYVLGDHLGYLGSVMPDMIVPCIIGKVSAGLISIVIAILSGNYFVAQGEKALKKEESNEELEQEGEDFLSNDGNEHIEEIDIIEDEEDQASPTSLDSSVQDIEAL